MILLAGEVVPSLHRAVVLSLGLVQNDSHPFPGRKEGVPDVGHRAALPLANHLHQGVDFDGPAAPVGAHPAAGALRAQKAQFLIQIFARNSLFLLSLSLLNTWQQIFQKLGLMSSGDKRTSTVILFNPTAEANLEQ